MTRQQGIALASRWLIEAGSAWAALVLLIFCVDPGRLSRSLALLLIIGPLCGCLASPVLLLAMWRDPGDLWWYRRWSYVGAVLVVTMFVLRALHLLTTPGFWGIGLVLAVSLFLRWRTRRVGAAPAPSLREVEPQAILAPASQSTVAAVPAGSQLVQRIGRGAR